LILFLDADIVLKKDWVKKVTEAFSVDTLAVQTSIVPKSKTNNLLQRIRKSRIFFNNNYSFLSLNKDNPKKLIINSAAFAIRREVFEKLEGFDEELTRHEDLDFTQRLIRKFKGELVSLSSIHADVYFSGSIFRYYLREFDCGFHIVRYHEKWSSTKMTESFHTLRSNLLTLLTKMKTLDPRDDLKVQFFFLEAFYLLGNMAGIFKKMISPYPKEQMDNFPIQAKVILK
jgi:cellulose synthase/poly-beta-1,6-N-acetylglucosamine synthase-like glycosyltransferase